METHTATRPTKSHVLGRQVKGPHNAIEIHILLNGLNLTIFISHLCSPVWCECEYILVRWFGYCKHNHGVNIPGPGLKLALTMGYEMCHLYHDDKRFMHII